MMGAKRRVLLLAAAIAVLFVGDPDLGHARDPEPKEATAAHPGDALLGEWWTEGREGRVRFVRHADGTYQGITTWRAPGPETRDNPFKDRKNPNPKLRDRATIGIVLIWNLAFEKAGKYTGGYVYNPRDGDTYRFKAQLVARDTLKIRGYMAIPLLGQSQTWTRYEANE